MPSTSLCCPPVSGAPPIPESEEGRDALLARVAKALGHPVRVAILRRLRALDGCCVGAIVDDLPLAQSTVSQHLKVLKGAGLIRGEFDGPRVCYCIEPSALDVLRALVADL